MPDENISSSAAEPLEAGAENYLVAQEELAEQSYNSSAITIVLGLMPADDNPLGRLGVLSVRNDQDTPLFGSALRGEELTSLLEAAPVARLLAELKALLPARIKARAQKEKERQTMSQPPPVPTTATPKPKADQKPDVNQSHVRAETTLPEKSESVQAEVTASTGADRVEPDNSKPQPDALPGKTTQLTLF